MKNLIILNSHPIQYYTPLYKNLTDKLDINLEVWFCTDDGVKEYFDTDFKTTIKWDQPLITGFKSIFLKNHSPFSKGVSLPLFGLVNFGIIKKLYNAEKSILWVDSWSQLSFIFFIIFGKIFGHKVCLRAETPISHELLKNKTKLFFRKIYFFFFFKFIDYFLYIGEQNRRFYKYYKCKDSQLIFCPYSVNNEFFKNENYILSMSDNQIKKIIGINKNHKILLVSGKLIDKKRPLDILKVFKNIDNSNLTLIFLGSGPLLNEMNDYIYKHKIKNVYITGFINQSEISKYYAICDVFIMASGIGETWGLATNEIMNFNASLVISNLTGCSIDLINNGENGYIFKTGDLIEMKKAILSSLKLDKDSIIRTNHNKLSVFSYKTIVNNFSNHFNVNYQ